MPYAWLIQTVPGFGIFLSVLVAVEIEDLGRFEDVSKLHAYAGPRAKERIKRKRKEAL